MYSCISFLITAYVLRQTWNKLCTASILKDKSPTLLSGAENSLTLQQLFWLNAVDTQTDDQEHWNWFATAMHEWKGWSNKCSTSDLVIVYTQNGEFWFPVLGGVRNGCP